MTYRAVCEPCTNWFSWLDTIGSRVTARETGEENAPCGDSTRPSNAEVAEAAWGRLAEILSIFRPLAVGPMPRLQADRRR
jgi:hypothetical protein